MSDFSAFLEEMSKYAEYYDANKKTLFPFKTRPDCYSAFDKIITEENQFKNVIVHDLALIIITKLDEFEDILDKAAFKAELLAPPNRCASDAMRQELGLFQKYISAGADSCSACTDNIESLTEEYAEENALLFCTKDVTNVEAWKEVHRKELVRVATSLYMTLYEIFKKLLNLSLQYQEYFTKNMADFKKHRKRCDNCTSYSSYS
jgi:hypothetical protein